MKMYHHWLFPNYQMTKTVTNYGMTFYAKNHLMMLQNFTFYIRFVTFSSNQNKKPSFKAWGSIQTKQCTKSFRFKSKSSNKPESSTEKSGSNSQSAARANKSAKQKHSRGSGSIETEL